MIRDCRVQGFGGRYMILSSKRLLFLCFSWLLIMTGCAASTGGQGKGSGFSPALQLLSLYKNHISPVDGKRCPSYPSCSSYAEQALKKHGFVRGWMMTVDRLIHEGDEETSVSPLVIVDGEAKIFDPVENNDFWWYPREP
jgi:hypothetical protein